jgi:hypothetical protein
LVIRDQRPAIEDYPAHVLEARGARFASKRSKATTVHGETNDTCGEKAETARKKIQQAKKQEKGARRNARKLKVQRDAAKTAAAKVIIVKR